MLFQIFFLLLPFQVACAWNFSSPFHHSLPSCLPQQSSALLQFKNTVLLRGYCEHFKTNSWNQSSDCCSWEGVSCHKLTGHVIGIDLSESCLYGTLLGNNSLFLLQSLRWLDLSFNSFDGPLLENSSTFRHLHGLKQLNLANNSFNGSISSGLFYQLVSLTHLDLSQCEFSGLVPHEISLLSKLVSLDLSYNHHYQELLRFDSLGFDMLARNLTKLKNLSLDYVDMSGVTLTSSLNFTSCLEHLSLSSCNLRGEFPSQVFSLPYLRYIDLESNWNLTGYLPRTNLSISLEILSIASCRFRGSVPASFGNLTQIRFLFFSDNNFSGQLPSTLFNLTQLTSLDLSSNNFGGQIPNVFENDHSKLTEIIFSNCNFSGQLPSTLFNLTQLTSLDLSSNNFGGQIPNVFENDHSKLTDISFRNCNFSGQLPSTLFNLTQLTYLDLSNNRIEGNLPIHVDRLQFQYLYLQNNLISGRVPSWLFTLPSLLDLRLCSNTLTGPIDPFQKPNSLLQEIDLSFNSIHGPIPDSFFELVNLSDIDLSWNNLSGVVQSSKLAKLKEVYDLDLSYNSLLSLASDDNDSDYSLTRFSSFYFSVCSITQFPSFLRTSHVQYLNLSNNKISGRIAKWEAQGWEDLITLDLSYNLLTSLEQVPGNLFFLNLGSNLLQGPMLSTSFNLQNLTEIQFFSVSNNKLSGNIPTSICNWRKIQVIDLSKNNLNGTIPSLFGNNTSVRFINFGTNYLHGEIPDSFPTDNSLTDLLLHDNQLQGSIPKSLANCSSLVLLNLRNNKLVDVFPIWVASLSSLQVLILSFNRLHGSLPNVMASSDFSALRIIDVSHNEFSGRLPINFFQILRAMKHLPDKIAEEFSTEHDYSLFARSVYDSFSTMLQGFYQVYVTVTWKRTEMKLEKALALFVSIDFSNNMFSGQIPKKLGKLISLQALNLSNNHLTGPIPSSIGNMVALESLDLSSNNLSGRIPSQLTNLTFLEVLNLSGNQLVGPIPTGRQFDTFENDSYTGNLGLCGLPLSKQCSNELGPMHVKHGGSTIEIPFIWKVVMMGYGSGVVLGVSMVYIVFTTGRPWWFVRKVERDWQTIVTNWIRKNRGRRN